LDSRENEKFQERAREVAVSLKPFLNKKQSVKIRTHTDPDGVSSGNIFARCLSRYDIPFHLSFGDPPSEEDIKNLENQDYDFYVFLDQGAGQFEYIEKHLIENDENVIIFDHHPGNVRDYPKLDYLNPHSFGISGSEGVSASGVTYSVVEKIDEKFESLSEIALIGAIGDRQNTPDGFTGINKTIQERALEKSFIEKFEGLKIGFRDEPLLDSIKNSVRPFLLGLSGNEGEVKKLLDSLDIGYGVSIKELEREEEKELRDGILDWVDVDSPEILERSIWGEIQRSNLDQTAGPENNHEFVLMLDACEKADDMGIGFSAMMGDEESAKRAKEILESYQRQMIEQLNWVAGNKDIIKDKDSITYLDFTEGKFQLKSIGELLSVILESGMISMDKPLMGLAESEEGDLKVSARGTQKLVEGGIDLGSVMNKASKEYGGRGGGHNIAAGARLPLEEKEGFIEEVNGLIEKFR